MPAIFVSHSSQDKKIADEVKEFLMQQGFERVFLDFDKTTGIGAGENWEKRLYEELSRCHALVLILTPNWLESKWCFVEFAQARALGKIILPIVCAPLGGRFVLPEIQAVDLLDWKADGLSRLALRLQTISNELARGFDLDPNRPPYPGIQAFEAEDAAIYFGRDDETRAVIEHLDARRTQGGARILLVLGASGSGKSSLLRAGVLPQLSRRKTHWLLLPPFRPERAPVEALAKAITHHLGGTEAWREWHSKLSGPDGVTEIEQLLKDLRVGQARSATALVSIDQFEEIFTVAEAAERTIFLRLLMTALDPARDLPLLAVATGRSDVLESMIAARELASLYVTYPLARMPLDRVPRLVEGPAAVAGINVEKGLSARITEDLESSDALPLLAHTLFLLHQRSGDSKKLTFAEYSSLGDTSRNLNPIQNSVRLVADQAIGGLRATDDELRDLREAFVPHLVRVRLDDGQRVRRPARMSELPSGSLRLVRALVEARLLSVRGTEDLDRPPTEGGEAIVEVTHEALFKAWPTLDQWLAEEHVFLSDVERLKNAREIWASAAGNQKQGALLLGVLLSRGRDWLRRYPQRFGGREMEPVREFIVASSRAEDEAQSRKQEEQRARQKLQRFALISVSTLLVLSVGVGLVALQQRNAARRNLRETRISRSRFLADLAHQKLGEGRIGAAVALARMAVPVEIPDWPKVPSAESALSEVVHAYSSAPIRPIVGFVGHEGTVRGASFSPDDKRVLTWSYDGTARVWDVSNGHQLAVLRHDGAIRGARFFSDGAKIVTWSFDGTARIWSQGAERPLAVLRHNDVVDGAVLSADEKRVLTWSEDGTARLWNVNGDAIAVMQHGGPVVGTVFFNKDSRILTWSFDGTIAAWDTATGKQLSQWSSKDNTIRGAIVLADQQRVLFWSSDKSVRLWDSLTGKELLHLDHDFSANGALLTKDEKRAVTWSGDKTARIWNLSTGRELVRLRHDAPVTGAVLSSKEDRLLTWCVDGTAALWDVASGKQLGHFSHTDMIYGARFSPDEQKVLTWSRDATAKLWKKPPGKDWTPTVFQHQGPVRRAAFSSDHWVWTSSDDGTVRVWSTDTGREYAVLRHQAEITEITGANSKPWELTASADGTAVLWDLSNRDRFMELAHQDMFLGAAFSPDSSKLLTWTGDKAVRVWNTSDGKQFAVLQHGAELLGARFFPDENRVLTWGSDNTVRIWAAERGNQLAAFTGDGRILGVKLSAEGDKVLAWFDNGTVNLWKTSSGAPGLQLHHDGSLLGAEFSADGNIVVAWTSEGKVQLWRSSSGELLRTFAHPGVIAAVLSPHQGRLITWSRDNTALLWNATTGERLAQMRHGGDVMGARYSADGKKLLTWADENTARVWDAMSGKQTAVLPHRNLVNGGVFYGDGKQVLTWSDDGTVRFWNAENGTELHQFRHTAGVREVVVSTDGLRLLTVSNDDVLLWDIASGNLLAAGTESSTKRALSPDAKQVLSWTGGPSAHLWSVWSPIDVLAKRATAITAMLNPLSRVDRCQAHLENENCESIVGTSLRDLALAGDERRPISPNAGNSTTTSSARYVSDETKIELTINDKAEVFIFHNKPFTGKLNRIEFNPLTKRMNLVINDRPRDFGIPVDPRLAKYFETAYRVLVVLMDEKTGKPIEGDYRPVLVY
jgi:WD40 repeat protein